MGWNPETGMWTPDVERQPLGALGSAMNFFNSRRAGDIASTLQQSREGQIAQQQEQLAQEQFKLEEAHKAAQRDDELRQALATAPEGADLEEIYMRQGDPSKLGPLYRTAMSGGIRKDVQGMKGNQALEQIQAKEDLPSTQAKIDTTQATGRLADTRANDIEATQQPRIDLMKARAELDRTLKQASIKKTAAGGLNAKDRAGIYAKALAYRQGIEKIEAKRDNMTLKLGAVDAANLDGMKKSLAALENLLTEEPASPTAPAAGAAKGADPSDPLGYFGQP